MLANLKSTDCSQYQSFTLLSKMQSIKLERPPCFNYLNMDRNWDVSDESNQKSNKSKCIGPSGQFRGFIWYKIVYFCTD